MKIKVRFFPAVVCIVVLFSIPSFAQNSSPKTASVDTVVSELGLLRESLDTLNVRLREINERVLTLNPNKSESTPDKQNRASLSLDILTRAEQRAELLRRQLLELVEKETTLKSRLFQIEEEIRPENIERSTSMNGTTRTAEMREMRRKVLETERRGVVGLLSQIAEGRDRLEENVRQADALVAKLRRSLLPLIEREAERLSGSIGN